MLSTLDSLLAADFVCDASPVDDLLLRVDLRHVLWHIVVQQCVALRIARLEAPGASRCSGYCLKPFRCSGYCLIINPFEPWPEHVNSGARLEHAPRGTGGTCGSSKYQAHVLPEVRWAYCDVELFVFELGGAGLGQTGLGLGLGLRLGLGGWEVRV